jgi:hypothetical protein
MIISYDKKYRQQVMEAFDLGSKEGLVVDKRTGNPIKDNLGGEVTVKRFGGVRKGSIEFINKDVSSLLKLRKKLKED